jgi:long-chain fatty acid transport protein
MKRNASCTLMLSLLASGLAAGDAWAQAQLPGYGHAAAGMGGASIAVPHDAIGAANNPALLAFVGRRADVQLTPIFTRTTSTLGPQRFESDVVGYGPSAGFNWEIDSQWTAGASLYGFGAGVDYGRPFPGSTSNTTSEVVQAIVAPTATWRPLAGQALGASLLLATQRYDVTGLQYIGFGDAGSDSSSGIGFALGYVGRLGDGVSIGATYASRIDMGKLDKYARLLADGGDLDIPQQAGVGIAWQATESLLLAADYLWINWSQVKPLGNPFPGSGPPGSPDGPGTGWQDQDIVRLGLAYEATPAWTLRAGLAFKSALVVPESLALNTLSPNLPQRSYTFGASWKLDAASVLSFAYALNADKTVVGTQASTGIAIESGARFLSLGYGRSF